MPTPEEVHVAGAAHKNLDGLAKLLDHAEDHLAQAAAAADKGSEARTSHAIEQTARNMRDTGEAVVAQASDALAPKPADTRIPESWPRPGRREISIAQRDMEAVTNRLSGLSQQIAAEKADLGGAAARFESNFVQTVDTALAVDPALQQKTREFVRQTLREKVAAEFREQTEALVGQVLEKKAWKRTTVLSSGSDSRPQKCSWPAANPI